jgi:acetylornithine deacetylase/succinyl-diaminopimelate desuccinylase-like protein
MRKVSADTVHSILPKITLPCLRVFIMPSGSFGGFTFYVGRQRFYPIMVAEKQFCLMKASVHGLSGHPSLPIRDGAMAKLARLLDQLNRYPLPTHVTPIARQMIQVIASALSFPSNLIIHQLLNPMLTNQILKLLGARGQVFEPLLHNVTNASLVHTGDKFNVVPMEISVELINLLLPGYSPEELMAELHQLLGSEVKFEVIRYDPCPAEPDMGLFDTLADILREADPGSKPVPMLLPAITDGRFFSRLGIQTYGFLPMNLPAEFNFTETMHAADERIPVEAVVFGIDAIYKALQRFGK